jgi:D-sedoheptulose 7-phosphate isomerase
MNRKINIHFNQASEGMTLVDRDEVVDVVKVLDMVRKNGKRVYVCGNGGSHDTASHFVNDLVKQCRVKAYCVAGDTSTVLAYGNDEGWENMFSAALRGKFDTGDCVVGISCSGDSLNVLNALLLAQQFGGFTVGLTGLSKSSKMALMGLTAMVYVPVPDIRVQEDLHLMICHSVIRQMQDDD